MLGRSLPGYAPSMEADDLTLSQPPPPPHHAFVNVNGFRPRHPFLPHKACSRALINLPFSNLGWPGRDS